MYLTSKEKQTRRKTRRAENNAENGNHVKSKTAFHVSRLNGSIKRQKLSDWIKRARSKYMLPPNFTL